MSQVQQAADLLFNLRQSGEIVKNIPDGLRPQTIDDGYSIQEALVAKLCDATNKPLKEGDLVISGTVNMIYAAQKGDHLEADFGLFGKVELRFD